MSEVNSKSIIKSLKPADHAFSAFYEEKIDYRIIYDLFYRHKWLIIIAGFIGVIFAFLQTLSMIPLYGTTAMIEVYNQESNNPYYKMGILSSSNSKGNSLLTLMRTRYILEPIVKQNALNLFISPHYYPVIGSWIARHYHGSNVASAMLPWLQSYAWGGEKIQLKKLIIPPQLKGHTFKLVVGKSNTYRLYIDHDQFILAGIVGKPCSSQNFAGFTLELSQLKAREHTEFYLRLNSPTDIANELSGHLTIDSVPSVDAMQNSGLFRIQLTGTDPNQIVKTLNAIINYTVLKDEQEKNAEAEKTLKFLYQRLPELKQKLDNAENNLNQYRVSVGSFNMTATGQGMINEQTNIQQEIEKLKSREIELNTIYTSEHPLVIAVQHQENELKNKVSELENKIKEFPIMYQHESALKTEFEIKSSMYTSMLKTIHELEVSQAGIIGDIRAISDATPAFQLPSKKPFSLLLGFFFGMCIASAGILLKSILNKTAANPDKLEEELQIPVQTIIPFSRMQKQLEKEDQKNLKIFGLTMSNPLMLATYSPNDTAVESLRSLHVSLQILTSFKKDNVIVIMGTSSSVGKSFTSLNLAQIIAKAGKKTLLIDADLRKGHLHRHLHRLKTPGLSEYLENQLPYEEVISSIHENLFFIANGKYTRHPAELLQKSCFETLIKRAKNEFEQIIIDTPPILPISDSLLIARCADIKLFIVNAHQDYLSDIKSAIKKAQMHGVEINGLLLNHTRPQAPYGGKYGYYYNYGYGHHSKDLSEQI
jgi:tyrosine-protein kinase Etk/Wzc